MEIIGILFSVWVIGTVCSVWYFAENNMPPTPLRILSVFTWPVGLPIYALCRTRANRPKLVKEPKLEPVHTPYGWMQ